MDQRSDPFLTKGDANAWVSAREAEIIEHRWRPAPPPARPAQTFAEYSARWLAGRELKPPTIREYTGIMKHLVAAFGTRYVDEIAGADIREWYATLDRAKPAARAHLCALCHLAHATHSRGPHTVLNLSWGLDRTHRANNPKWSTNISWATTGC